jgi:hypothetical protein
MTYISIGINCWGKASTIEESIKLARSNWRGARKSWFNIFVTEATFDEVSIDKIDGTIWCPTEKPCKQIQKSTYKQK